MRALQGVRVPPAQKYAPTHRVIKAEAHGNIAEVVAIRVRYALVAQRDVQHEIAARQLHDACAGIGIGLVEDGHDLDGQGYNVVLQPTHATYI